MTEGEVYEKLVSMGLKFDDMYPRFVKIADAFRQDTEYTGVDVFIALELTVNITGDRNKNINRILDGLLYYDLLELNNEGFYVRTKNR